MIDATATQAVGPICVLDDDSDVRAAMDSLLRSVGFTVLTFETPDQYLTCSRADEAACLLLDVRLNGLNGLDFQQELLDRHIHVPIILMTGHGDIQMTVRGMKAGAVNFLTKPCNDDDILAAIAEAVALNQARRAAHGRDDHTRRLYNGLTPREREVMSLVTAGLLNKQVAGRLNVSEITVKIHRGNMMRKMHAQSLADLVRMAETLGVREVTAARFAAYG
ncbi:FixJ family two-component response regulator [Sphingomonas sp. BE270]|jgi:FixJ family two-component response regulator|nr:response regulator [Sphingomonas sp. BE270]MDR7258615.1 FixJ family two-component response regulator [Sphingomonas sp. BE270]RUN76006.1 response regulator transcription factor [Sphingomonas sp. TF3]